MERGGFGSPIGHRDPDPDIRWCCLGVLHHDIEVAVVVEYTGIDQLVLEGVSPAAGVGLHQVVIWKRSLRVAVQEAQVGVGRRRVEVVVVLLGILAVVALAVGQTEYALLENGIVAVPQRDGEAQPQVIVRYAGQAVLSPVVGTRPSLIVREVTPRIAVGAVVLAHRAPLSLG